MKAVWKVRGLQKLLQVTPRGFLEMSDCVNEHLTIITFTLSLGPTAGMCSVGLGGLLIFGRVAPSTHSKEQRSRGAVISLPSSAYY